MKVLVAVDKNPETYTGLRYACHLLENNDAQVDALHVTPALAELAAESYAPFVTSAKVVDSANAEVAEVQSPISSKASRPVQARESPANYTSRRGTRPMKFLIQPTRAGMTCSYWDRMSSHL